MNTATKNSQTKKLISKSKESSKGNLAKTVVNSSAELGEQSKKILNKLIPLIRFCKDHDSTNKPVNNKQNVNHKKSNSMAIGNNSDLAGNDSTIGNTEKAHEKIKNSEQIKPKTSHHGYQKSVVPPRPVIKLENESYENQISKPEEIQIPQKVRGPIKVTIELPQKGTHIRAKSDCPKIIPTNAITIVPPPPKNNSKPKGGIRHVRAISTDKERTFGEPKNIEKEKRKISFNNDSIEKPRKNSEPRPNTVKTQSDSNYKKSIIHKRSASDGPAIQKKSEQKNNTASREGTLAKQSQSKESRGTPNIISKGFELNNKNANILKDKIPTSAYYSLTRPVKSTKRSISSLKNTQPEAQKASTIKPKHERSISTQIKINTYLQENGPSKVISITQDTRIDPYAKDSIDVDIVNIAIKRKDNSKPKQQIVVAQEISPPEQTKYKQYSKLISKGGNNNAVNSKLPEDEVIRVGKHYFTKPNITNSKESIEEKYKSNSHINPNNQTELKTKDSIEKAYKSNTTASYETVKTTVTPLKTKEKVNKASMVSSTKQPIVNISKSVAIKKTVQEKLLNLPEKSNLTTTNLAKLEYAKEISELTKFIKNYFKEHNEAPPTTAEFYRIGKLLGKGAFGKVNLGMHKLTGKMVAIKSINKQYLTDESSKKKVMQEYSILKQMRNESIIRLYETFETPKHILFVIELCCGGDLLTYVRKRRKLKEETARSIFQHLIEGLNYCHKKYILHRDIKLDNILLNAFGHIKICDFGVSKAVKAGERLTEQCGTPAYIAPEILRGKGYEGFGVDIWSAGVVLYAMLYGTVPFKANNMKDLHKLITKGKYVLKEGISEEAKDLLKKMLEIDPRKRIPISAIFRHKWIQGSKNPIIFTDTETEAIMKEYQYAKKDENIENRTLFTEQNIDSTINDLTKNNSTKSIVLAPFNSTKSNLSDIHSSVEELMQEKKQILKFAAKVRDIDRQYEKNNNAEIDNGVYNKLVCTSSQSEQSRSLSNSESQENQEENLEPHTSSANLNSVIEDEDSKNVPREDRLNAKGFIIDLPSDKQEEQKNIKEEVIIGIFPFFE